jgi:hypothetical protein
MVYTGTAILYPDLSDATDGATDTATSSSLYDAGGNHGPCKLVSLTILVPPASDATLVIGSHAGTALVGKTFVIDSALVCPHQIYLNDFPSDSGLSMDSDVALTAALDWKARR